MSKSPLGRGLSALLGGGPAVPRTALPSVPPAAVPDTDVRERILRVTLDRLQPSPLQPRKDFPAEALRELADSIKEQGVVQPLIVRERGDGYELIAGERRWRAAQLAGLTEVPVIVREADDRTVLELALIENLQRENLNPIEEALGFQQLVEQFQLRQEDVAVRVGKSRVAVANALRLLKLPADLQVHVRDGRLSVGHAKVILGLPLPQQMQLAAERAITDSLNVRQVEELVSRLSAPGTATTNGKAAGHATVAARDPHVAALESRLRERFGTKVGLRYRQGRGALEIRFFSDDELDRILEIVGVKMD